MAKEKKKYYSPIKEYDTFYRPHIFYKILRFFVKLFFPKNDFIWKTEKPAEGEPFIYVCNHTKIYAPTYFLVQHYEKNIRLWANCFFLYFDMCWNHVKNCVLRDRKPKFLLYPLAFLLTPVIVLTFRAINPITTFHKCEKVETYTFKKSIDTLDEGIPQIIFPERTVNKVNRYVYQFKHGFPLVAEKYYKKTGKKIKFYPVYCAQALRTFVVGDPIEYNPDIPIETQKDDICHYLEDAIAFLGDSLPEHEPALYG